MATFGTSVGRIRVTSVVSPSEAGYIRSMRDQASDMDQVIKNVIKKFRTVSADAMMFAAQPIMDRSQELVPVDTGRLINSAFLFKGPESKLGNIKVFMGYARFGQPHYAAFVHERVDIKHAKGKSAKFLEKAVNEKLPVFTSRLIAFYRKGMGSL